MNVLAIIAVVAAIIGLAVAIGLASWIGKAEEGTDRMKEIAGYIREGAMASEERVQNNGYSNRCALPAHRLWSRQLGNGCTLCIRCVAVSTGRLLRNEGGYAR